MKKTIFLILLSMLSVYSFAQRFGVKAGINLASFYGDDSKGAKSIPGYHIGGVVEFPVNYDFSIQTELLLSKKGAKYAGILSSYGDIPDINDGIRDYDYSDKPLYIEVPINAVFNFDSWTGRIVIAVGPYFAIGVGGKRTYESTLNGKKTTKSFNLYSREMLNYYPWYNYKQVDYGIGANVGYEFASKVFANIGTSIGLSNINNADVGINPNPDLKNFVLTLSIGYKFRQP
ncbi:MAG: porin family protein [Bacteroidota bacterium]|nr:porin family protein [Bacteroidota bacterium]